MTIDVIKAKTLGSDSLGRERRKISDVTFDAFVVQPDTMNHDSPGEKAFHGQSPAHGDDWSPCAGGLLVNENLQRVVLSSVPKTSYAWRI